MGSGIPVKRLRIYVAGAYTASSTKQRLQNTTDAIDAGLAVWNRGHFPYIPHLTHYVDVRAKRRRIPMHWQDYIEWDKTWLKCCDGFLLLNHSKGSSIELRLAHKLRLRIFRSIGEIPDVGPHRLDKALKHDH